MSLLKVNYDISSKKMQFEIVHTRGARCTLFLTYFVIEKYSAYHTLRIETGLYFQWFVIFEILC